MATTLKEYNSLFTFGKLTPLSAIAPELTAFKQGIGYPWFLFDPTLQGFQTSKNFYLSSTIRQVQGYPQTVIPNNIQEAYGKSIPWSNFTVPASNSYINQAFVDNCKDQPFWFYVVPPSGDPVLTTIHFPKFGKSSSEPIPPLPVTPTNHIYLAPVALETGPFVTLEATLTGVLLRTTYSNRTISAHSASPALTSLYWIESFLGFCSLMNQSSGFRLTPTYNTQNNFSLQFRPFDPTPFLQAKSYTENTSRYWYNESLITALTSTNLLSQNLGPGNYLPTGREALSGLYSAREYPVIADARTWFDYLTGNKYKYEYPTTWAGVRMYRQALTPQNASLIMGVPTSNYAGLTSNWSQEIIKSARSTQNELHNYVLQNITYWRTLTAIPLSAREIFNFNPLYNSMVITKVNKRRFFSGLTSRYALYHPTLNTWVVYTSAPGLAHFTKTGLITSSNFQGNSDKIRSIFLSAIDLNINTPDFWKFDWPLTYYGKYITFPGKTDKQRQNLVKVLSAEGSIPLSALTVIGGYHTGGSLARDPYFVTDVVPIQRATLGSVLSGTVYFYVSGSVPSNNLPNVTSSYKNVPTSRILLPTTLVGVRTTVLITSSAQLKSTFDLWGVPTNTVTVQIRDFSLSGAVLSGFRPGSPRNQEDTVPLLVNVLPEYVYVKGTIPLRFISQLSQYRGLTWSFTAPNRYFSIPDLLRKEGVTTFNGIASDTNNEPIVDILNNEVIMPAPINSIGSMPFDWSRKTLSPEAHTQNNRWICYRPFNLQPTFSYFTPLTTASTFNWAYESFSKSAPRTVKQTFVRQRRKRVLGF